jgi:hypothetical protein
VRRHSTTRFQESATERVTEHPPGCDERDGSGVAKVSSRRLRSVNCVSHRFSDPNLRPDLARDPSLSGNAKSQSRGSSQSRLSSALTTESKIEAAFAAKGFLCVNHPARRICSRDITQAKARKKRENAHSELDTATGSESEPNGVACASRIKLTTLFRAQSFLS